MAYQNIIIKKQKLGFQKKIKYITFLGKLEHAKGAEQFVRAMCKVLEKNNSNVLINVIGFGSLRKELIAYTSLCGLSKHFKFIEIAKLSNYAYFTKHTYLCFS